MNIRLQTLLLFAAISPPSCARSSCLRSKPCRHIGWNHSVHRCRPFPRRQRCPPCFPHAGDVRPFPYFEVVLVLLLSLSSSPLRTPPSVCSLYDSPPTPTIVRVMPFQQFSCGLPNDPDFVWFPRLVVTANFRLVRLRNQNEPFVALENSGRDL